jgi:serine/threonine protein kinase
MPAPTTVPDFLALIERSGLLEPTSFSQYVDTLRKAQALPAAPEILAERLVRDGQLTRFQAQQLLEGKCRQFSLAGYIVLDRIGVGGMGSVYLCEDRKNQRRAALKVLALTRAQDSTALQRFQREARAVTLLDHPNVIRAYEVGQDQGLHFLAMEYIDGPTLQEIVHRQGPLAPDRAADYLRQAALGLQHAHEHGLVHRDIKPANLVVNRAGVLKILDLGLARFCDSEDDGLTRDSDEGVIGTADYLAPEQAMDSHDVDIRADLYSLGATFYFCLTGQAPFPGGTAAQKLLAHLHRQPQPVQSIRPQVPVSLAAVIDRLLAKKPEDRFMVPVEVAAAVEPFAKPGPYLVNSDSDAGSSTIVERLPVTRVEPGQAAAAGAKPLERSTWKHLGLAGGVLGLLLGLIVFFALLFRGLGEDRTIKPTTSPEPTGVETGIARVGRDFPNGFASITGLKLNGSAQVPPGVTFLRITDNQKGQAGSFFSTERLGIDHFTNQFDFQIQEPRGDGFAFVIQAGDRTALGAAAANLGYSGDPNKRMNHSLAVKFDLFDNAGEGPSSTGLFLNGAIPTNDGVVPLKGTTDLRPAGIDLHSSHVFNVVMDYDGKELRVKITDPSTKATAEQVYAVDIPAVIGSRTAYVGFTAATGGDGAFHDILRWTYKPL